MTNSIKPKKTNLYPKIVGFFLALTIIAIFVVIHFALAKVTITLKSQYQEKNQTALAEFILPLEVVDFDEPATLYYGTLRVMLEKQGTPIGALDMMIAAHALSLNVSLVTNNTKEFNRVLGLKLLDWISH